MCILLIVENSTVHGTSILGIVRRGVNLPLLVCGSVTSVALLANMSTFSTFCICYHMHVFIKCLMNRKNITCRHRMYVWNMLTTSDIKRWFSGDGLFLIAVSFHIWCTEHLKGEDSYH